MVGRVCFEKGCIGYCMVVTSNFVKEKTVLMMYFSPQQIHGKCLIQGKKYTNDSIVHYDLFQSATT